MGNKINNNWFKLERSALSSDMWNGKFSKVEAYVYLAMKARWQKDSCIEQNITVNTGQLIVTYRELSMIFKWSLGSVSRFCEELKNKGIITIQGFKNASLITIINQASEDVLRQIWNANGTQNGTQNGISKINNISEIDSVVGTQNGTQNGTQTEHLAEKEKKQKKEIYTKKEETPYGVPKNSINYQKIAECWNEYNGPKLGFIRTLTDRRKQQIKKQLDNHKISEEQLMAFFRSLPYADKWLYNPNKEHSSWKPDFDWWIANTNGWLTKGLEGKVHKENPQAFSMITTGNNAPYIPAVGGDIMEIEPSGCYKFIGIFYDSIADGYTDNNRPDGAKLILSNARGEIIWNANEKKWIRHE